MRLQDVAMLSTRAFKTNPARTWLTIAGMGVGTGAVVTLVGLGFGIGSQVTALPVTTITSKTPAARLGQVLGVNR